MVYGSDAEQNGNIQRAYTLYINYIMCTVILQSTYVQYNFVVKCQMK